MKLELKKENKKAAIIMLNGRLNLTTTDMISVQLDQIKKMLVQMYDRTVDYVSYPAKKEEKERTDYKDVKDTNLNDYDEVYIYESSLNLFGGVFSMFNILTFKQLVNFKGKVYYILSDPRFPCLDFSTLIMYKMSRSSDGKSIKAIGYGHKGIEEQLVTEEECNLFHNNVFPNIITCFNGYDYDLYLSNLIGNSKNKKKLSVRKTVPASKDWIEFTFFEYFGVELSKDSTIFNDYDFASKKYDLVYYGINRRNERNAIIADLYKNKNHSKLFVGFDGVELENTTRIDRVAREELFKTIATNSLATIVIGDRLHNNNCITFRFYEAMMMDVAALIYDDFDVSRRLVKDLFLQQFIFVKTEADVADRISKLRSDEKLYRKIVDLERKEVKRILSTYTIK